MELAYALVLTYENPVPTGWSTEIRRRERRKGELKMRQKTSLCYGNPVPRSSLILSMIPKPIAVFWRRIEGSWLLSNLLEEGPTPARMQSCKLYEQLCLVAKMMSNTLIPLYDRLPALSRRKTGSWAEDWVFAARPDLRRLRMIAGELGFVPDLPFLPQEPPSFHSQKRTSAYSFQAPPKGAHLRPPLPSDFQAPISIMLPSKLEQPGPPLNQIISFLLVPFECLALKSKK